LGQPVRVTLLHICKEDKLAERLEELEEFTDELANELGADLSARVVCGDLFPSIEAASSGNEFQLMLVGTHGVKGIRQFLFGSDILHLVRHAKCPSLVLQEQSNVHTAFHRALLPAGAHAAYLKLVESLVPLFKANSTEVILYDILRPMESLSEVLVENRSKALAIFEAAGINCRIVEEESNTVSFGFAKQTLAYAKENKVDLIAIVPQASEEFTYMADAEKERFLTNDSGIPIWCCG
jgi:nucleotide-binding universal stress UspA family protein